MCQNIFRQSFCRRLGWWRRIEFINKIRKTENVLRLVVQSDVEILRIHQLADYLMNGSIKFLHIFGDTCLSGNAIESGTKPLRAFPLRNVAKTPNTPDTFSRND